MDDDNDHLVGQRRTAFLDHHDSNDSDSNDDGGSNVLSQHAHDPYQNMDDEMGEEGDDDHDDDDFCESHHQSQNKLHHPAVRSNYHSIPMSISIPSSSSSSSAKGASVGGNFEGKNIPTQMCMNKLELSHLRDRAASVRAHVRDTQLKARSLTFPKAVSSLSSLPLKGMYTYE